MESSFSKFNLKFYNLQPCYEDEFHANHTNPQDYYWKYDGHHNAKGYEMMAKCLEEIITPLIEKRVENQNTLVN
jgi:lysophospholipase L1-like esterase